jgi:hypothetical protein
MHWQHLKPGLYWIMQSSPKKGVEHHAILDVCNRMRYADAGGWQDMIVHQTPPAIRREPSAGTGNWVVLQKIADEQNAIRRLISACANPGYRTIDNNCEHFARYIATGIRESHQLQRAGAVVIAIGLVWAAAA